MREGIWLKKSFDSNRTNKNNAILKVAISSILFCFTGNLIIEIIGSLNYK